MKQAQCRMITFHRIRRGGAFKSHTLCGVSIKYTCNRFLFGPVIKMCWTFKQIWDDNVHSSTFLKPLPVICPVLHLLFKSQLHSISVQIVLLALLFFFLKLENRTIKETIWEKQQNWMNGSIMTVLKSNLEHQMTLSFCVAVMPLLVGNAPRTSKWKTPPYKGFISNMPKLCVCLTWVTVCDAPLE